ncbi:MAG: DUF2183 domain-containing protein [Lewinellaceae bacterium]|nr:DUF2183 domain-containing protein [Phaeodactylibacter sp.]MCB0613569.1 DUF2183 domain-containing protein [Phaeodactylibacter sp.]MCB9346263.1 DUF2183 domain-containing protein [Lewinellaceae bacterium]
MAKMAKGFLLQLLRSVDRISSRFSRQVKALLGYKPNWPVMVATYRGYGRKERAYLKGRVLKDRRIIARNVNSRWRALINNYKRFSSREIGGATVGVRIGDNEMQLITDEEGYFQFDGNLSVPLPDRGDPWREAHIRVTATPQRQVDVQATGSLLIPPPIAEFGVISDVDDTVLQTDVTSLLKLRVLYHTLLKSAALRRSFGQAAAFFQALHWGNHEQSGNPVFYVSNSPWNLYDLLEEFLSLNGLPNGPILLRDFGIPYQEHPGNYKGHKHSSIVRILNTYPELPFILIGDSGEKDAYIYWAVAQEFPGRIAATYIRDVRSGRRARRIARFIEKTGADIQMVQDYTQAAGDAARRGLIQLEIFEQFRKERLL